MRLLVLSVACVSIHIFKTYLQFKTSYRIHKRYTILRRTGLVKIENIITLNCHDNIAHFLSFVFGLKGGYCSFLYDLISFLFARKFLFIALIYGEIYLCILKASLYLFVIVHTHVHCLLCIYYYIKRPLSN